MDEMMNNRPEPPDSPSRFGGRPEPTGPLDGGHTTPPDAPAVGGWPSRKGQPGIAWVVIVVCVIGMIVLRQVGMAMVNADPNADDPIGITIAEITAKYVMGSKSFTTSGDVSADALYGQTAPSLRVGSVNQRIAFVVFANEMVGPEEASAELESLLLDIENAQAEAQGDPVTGEFELREEQDLMLSSLETMYHTETGDVADEPQVEALTAAQRDALKDNLGWFGKLALAPPGSNSDARKEIEAGARRLVFTIVVVFVLGAIGGLIGFGLLITFFVLAATRRIRSGVDRIHAGLPENGAWHHGVYAETFAVWFLLFIVLLFGSEVVALSVPQYSLLISAAAFFLSLTALAWPVLRGIEWKTVRAEIGLTAGRDPAWEPFIGGAGYLAALPLLAFGIAGVFILMMIQAALPGPPAPIFGGSGGAAHPIVAEIASGDLVAILQIYLVASVAAPIVEETVFRGVLYRHLRDATRRWALPLSVLFGSVVNCFVFAIIHPQGWVAAPALMSLAFAFTLAREWRGTLIPAMIMHAISNGVVMSILVICLNS